MEKIMTKVCTKCGEEKPITEFRESKTGADGYRTDCKECERKYDRKRYQEKKSSILAQKRKYQAENRDRVLSQKRKHKNDPANYSTFYEKMRNYYPDDQIQRDPKHPNLLQVRCKYCGNWFNPTVSQIEHRYQSIVSGTGGRELYCSDACKHACPIFNQSRWPKDFKQNTSREVQPELRKMVLKRDKWTCQRCGKTKEEYPELELHCHHIFPLNEDPIGSADLDNCITYCKGCHRWVHMNVPGCGYAEMKCSKT